MKKIIILILLSILAYSEATCSVTESGNEYVVNVHKSGFEDVTVKAIIPERLDIFKTKIKWGTGYNNHIEGAPFIGDVRFVEVLEDEDMNITITAPRKIYAKTNSNGELAASIPANWRFRLQADGVTDGWHIHYPILKMNGYGSQYQWVGKCDDRQIIASDGNGTGWMRVHHDDFNVTQTSK